MRESWSFGRYVCRYLEWQVRGVDVVYANTWPLLSQALIARHCCRWGIPLVLHVQDIYPESLETRFPVWLAGLVVPPLRAWDRRTAHRAAKIVVIAEGTAKRYALTRRLPAERLAVIRNWQDQQPFLDVPPRVMAAQQHAVNGALFTFLYLGNIGPTTDMELVIRAFSQASISGSQLLVVGDGSWKQHCVALAQRTGGVGVRFLSCPSSAEAPALQSLADVCLLPLKRGVAMNGVPSKLAAYLFSAKPVLATLDAGSDTARCIEEAQCGWVGEPGQLAWLAAKMAEVAALPPSKLEAMGQSGRAYGLKHFSKAEGVKRLAEVVLSAAGHRHL
jgi:glycosyltransferase involved in cell wall biosynthesis